MKTRRVFSFEGHLKEPHTKYLQHLLDYTDFTDIRNLGTSEGRDLFRWTREVLGAAECYTVLTHGNL